MSKLDWFTILVVGVCIAAILYLLYNMTNLFGDKTQTGDQTEVVDVPAPTTDDVYDEYDTDTRVADEEMGDKSSDNGRVNEGPGAGGSEGINYDDNEDPSEDAVIKTPTTPTPPVKDANGDEMRDDIASGLGNGRYMVIYGTFKYMSSARKAQAQLRRKGFDDASIEIFNGGKYARVLVGRSNDYDEAADLKSALRGAGITDVIIQEKRGQR